MIHIKQTKFGLPHGNCFAACLASLLEVPIEEVTIEMQADDWFDQIQAYLKPKNLYFLEVRIDVAVQYPLYAMNGIYCVMSGKSPRGDFNHAVVGRIDSETDRPVVFNMVHDPHPDNKFLVEGSLWGLGFIMKLDPAKP